MKDIIFSPTDLSTFLFFFSILFDSSSIFSVSSLCDFLPILRNQLQRLVSPGLMVYSFHTKSKRNWAICLGSSIKLPSEQAPSLCSALLTQYIISWIFPKAWMIPFQISRNIHKYWSWYYLTNTGLPRELGLFPATSMKVDDSDRVLHGLKTLIEDSSWVCILFSLNMHFTMLSQVENKYTNSPTSPLGPCL